MVGRCGTGTRARVRYRSCGSWRCQGLCGRRCTARCGVTTRRAGNGAFKLGKRCLVRCPKMGAVGCRVPAHQLADAVCRNCGCGPAALAARTCGSVRLMLGFVTTGTCTRGGGKVVGADSVLCAGAQRKAYWRALKQRRVWPCNGLEDVTWM